MKKLFTIALVLLALTSCNQGQKKIMFDLAHSQCTDVYKGHETYPLVVPAYTEMAQQLNAELVVNEEAEITPQLLKGIDVLVMLSPLRKNVPRIGLPSLFLLFANWSRTKAIPPSAPEPGSPE